jgi:hypothetical protein
MNARPEMLIEEENRAAPTVAERRALIDRVAASSQFSRSARLRDFLLYVGRESLKDGVQEIHELEIGVRVFGRSPSYDRSQDNIVRVNATELRRRIDAYFGGEGAAEPLIFSIPRGGYRPVFRWRDSEENATTTVAVPTSSVEVVKPTDFATLKPAGKTQLPVGWIALSLVLAAACGVLSWQNHSLRKKTNTWEQQPLMTAFWTDFARSAPQTDIVLPDASVSMREEMLGTGLSLNDYLDRNFLREATGEKMSDDRKRALETIFNHNLVTLGDFHAAQQVLGLASIVPSMRLTLARFYEAESIKRDNVILIGGKKANPWARLLDDKLNFPLEYDNDHSQAYVANRHPAPGEQEVYAPVMERNALTAYSVIAFLPNPSRTGKMILLAGTDSDATGAAAEFLTSEEGLRSLKQKFHAQKSYFEVLLKTSRLSGTSFSAEPLAFREYDTKR